jgi:hypothetical protein
MLRNDRITNHHSLKRACIPPDNFAQMTIKTCNKKSKFHFELTGSILKIGNVLISDEKSIPHIIIGCQHKTLRNAGSRLSTDHVFWSWPGLSPVSEVRCSEKPDTLQEIIQCRYAFAVA